ncbi:hypothetical protein CYY_001455 [Polysphondylium violaceum]|uniref:Pleckstrin domain-containing protein n=1 Tax=Polysphondylium violaceum TaxID=133409 RepID=A0A8J4UW74_9MYCE|nr:hypothetical protein CYY_001455 [Polysphondylium violaceum]
MEAPVKKILKVFDQDGLYKTMAIEPSSTSDEICEKFAKKLFLNRTDITQFGLFLFEGGLRTQLKPTDFPFDFLVKNEKKDHKFYFLDPTGEFISFQEKASTAKAGGGPPSHAPPNPNTGGSSNSNNSKPNHAPPQPKATKGKSGYIMRKRAGRFETVWAVSKDQYLRLYESEDEMSSALYELPMENAIIEYKTNESVIVFTTNNSERYTFTCEKESDLSDWATELQATTAYSSSQKKAMNPAMMMGMGTFIPTSKDLNIKLSQKLENTESLGKALLNWTNFILSGKQLVCDADILTAYSDGSILVNLIDNLFDKQIVYRKGKSVYEMQHNLDKSFEVLKQVNADYGKIIAQDIIECKVSKVVIRLVWSIFISFFTKGEKEYVAKERLIAWCSKSIHEYPNNKAVGVVSGPNSLSNPLVFAALIDKYRPNTLDFNSLTKKSREEQAAAIIDVAHDKLSIPKIIDSSFFQEDQMDEKSFLLYLSMYYYYLSNEADSDRANIIKTSPNPRDQLEGECMVSNREKQMKILKEKHQQQEEEEKERKRKEKEIADAAAAAELEQQQAKEAEVAKPTPTVVKKPLPTPISKPIAKPIAKKLPAKLPATTVPESTPSQPEESIKKPLPTPVSKPIAKPIAKKLPAKQPAAVANSTTSTPSPPSPKPPPRKLPPQVNKQEQQEKEEQARKEKEQEESRLLKEKEEQETLNALEELELHEQRLREEQESLAALSGSLTSSSGFMDQQEEEIEEIIEEEQEEQDSSNNNDNNVVLIEKPKSNSVSSGMNPLDILDMIEKNPSSSELEAFRKAQQEKDDELMKMLEFDQQNEELEMFAQEYNRVQQEQTQLDSLYEKQQVFTLDHHNFNVNNVSTDDQPINDSSASTTASATTDEAPKKTARKPLPTLTKEQQEQRMSVMRPKSVVISPDVVSSPPDGADMTEPSNKQDDEDKQQDKQDKQDQQQTTQQQNTQQPKATPPGRVVVRICLEGFGEVLFCSFAIGYDTLCGQVRDMVIKKMKVSSAEENEYALHIVRDGLERVLDDDEVLLEAEDKIDRFVFKKNEIDRRYLISNHRPNK